MNRAQVRPASGSSLLKRIVSGLVFAALTINIVVPKAGLKIGDVPVTVGTVLCVLALAGGMLGFLAGRLMLMTSITGLALLLASYMSVRSTIGWLLGDDSIEYAWGLVIGPLLFILITNVLTTNRDVEIAARIVVVGFVIVSAYAMLQFILGVNTVAIPGVTVNLTDFQAGQEWYLEKHNRVGSGAKLFSTYQNGNLLGVNLLLLFPIVYEVVKKRWKIPLLLVFVAVCLLTLSRSAWLGVVVYLGIRFVFTKSATASIAAARIFAGLGLLVAGVLLFGAIPQLTERLFRSDLDSLTRLSGRTPRLSQLIESTIGNPIAVLFGPHTISTFEGSAYEITFGAVYLVGGVVAVFLLLVIQIKSIATLLRSADRVAVGVGYGVAVYAVASLVEGGFWLPPTASLFWMLLGVGFAAVARGGRVPTAHPFGTLDSSSRKGQVRNPPRSALT